MTHASLTIVPRQGPVRVFAEADPYITVEITEPITIEMDSAEALLKRPLISSSGLAYIPQAELRKEDLRIVEACIRGETTLRIYSADNGNFFATDFSYNGTMSRKSTPTIGFSDYSQTQSEWDLPWIEIMTSIPVLSYNIVFVIVLAMLLLKRKTKSASNSGRTTDPSAKPKSKDSMNDESPASTAASL